MSSVKIKICGLSRACDIDCVNECKPDFIGFVFAKSRRRITFERAELLKKRLDPAIKAAGVFVNEAPEVIISAAQNGIIDIIQLHGQEDEQTVCRLKEICRIPVIKAVSVGRDDISAFAGSSADYLLLDNGAGGTGKAFDWSLAGNIKKPFFLAGGLNAENVKIGIEKLRPFAVDISGGVETGGFKDPEKIREIIRRIRNE